MDMTGSSRAATANVNEVFLVKTTSVNKTVKKTGAEPAAGAPLLPVAFSPPHAENYFRKGFNSIPGWAVLNTLRLLRCLDAVQRSVDEVGGVGQLGVDQGKLFIALAHLSRAGEAQIAIEDFESAKSGKNLQLFLDHFARHYDIDENLHVINSNVAELESADILQKSNGPLRLFCVDAEPTFEAVTQGLMIAESVLSECGIVVVSNVFNDWWPGVTEGVVDLLRGGTSRLVPVAIVGTSAAFAFEGFRERAQRELKLILGSSARREKCGVVNVFLKETIWLGAPTVCARFHDKPVAAKK